MLWIDSAILMLTGIAVLAGLWRGFRRTVYAVMVWIIATIVGWFFSQDLAPFLAKQIPEPIYRMFVAFSALVLITLGVGWTIRLLLGKTTNNPPYKIMARLYGGLLGTVHGAAMVLAVVILSGLTPLPKDSWWRQSKFLPFFQGFVVDAKRQGASRLASFLDYSPRLKTQAK
jgi:membrane protein required for colicin V production